MRQAIKPARKKKCKGCGNQYSPYNTAQQACSVRCAIVVGQATQRKAYDKETRARKQSLLTKRDHIKLTQVAFNKMIRSRDSGKCCISCGQRQNDTGLITGSRTDAGHYRSIGASPELRFCEDNCHAQCSRCNNQLSGNVVNYRAGLKKRIGETALEWLEGPHEAKKYTVDELIDMRASFNRRAREIIEGTRA